VIAELWKREPDEEDYYEPEVTYVKTKKELKREEKERAKRLKEEERQIKVEEKQDKKEKKRNRKDEKRIVRTGGFVDEIFEEDLVEEEPVKPVTVQTATSEAHELLKKEIAAATAEDVISPEKFSESQQEPVSAPKETPEPETEEDLSEEEEMPAEIKKLAIPVLSAAQLADKAKRDGDAPDIVKDNITKVTLFDYSDIISEDEKEVINND
jgi:hypothetical protein